MQTSTEQLTNCSIETPEEESAALTTQSVSEKIMTLCRNTIKWILLVDLVLAVSVLALLAILEFGMVPHQRIGFFCNDPKLSFKFMGDTISIGLLISGSILIPIIVMWITEYSCYSADSYDAVSDCAGKVRHVWSWYGHYTVGIIILAFICDIMKVIVGEPRPHFLDTCRPQEAVNCTDKYVISYTCTNTIDSSWFVLDSSKSFPSGHSAFSMYTAIFMVWYLQVRLPNRTFLLKPWLQCLMCLWAVTCSLTRIGDNRHHWWDVLAGDVLGSVFGLFNVIVPCQKFNFETKTNVRTLNKPIENGQINFNEKKEKNIKQLLNSVNSEVSEGREMKDIRGSWKE